MFRKKEQAHADPQETLAGGAPSSIGKPVTGKSHQVDRDWYASDELAIVMSHYDVGAIQKIGEFSRGSRRAPKLLIDADQGRFLLKRRAKGRDDPYKVAFSHALQLHLAHKQFPLPHLIGTRKDNNSMLQLGGQVYELFEYVPGQSYPSTVESTQDTGRVLSLFHKLLDGFTPEWQSPVGSYHATATVETGLKRLPEVLSGGGRAAELVDLAHDLADRYKAAATEAEGFGLKDWRLQICHADWHPGNMLFRDNHVVAVIDYDSARMLPKVIDVANGALQFSIIGGEGEVAKWPDHVDEERFRKFMKGYDSVQMLSQAELSAVPSLMIEALIAEAVLPIAATGTFGRLEGLTFLKMVQRKASWLRVNTHRLIGIAGGN
jgi:homoserine kinase type II